MTSSSAATEAAYAHCAALVRAHYENFPVASRLLPGHLRKPIAAIYAFARGADDIADEGDALPEQRLSELDRWTTMLDAAAAGEPPDHPVFVALADAMRTHDLPARLLHDLVDAFRLDIRQRRWPDFDALLGYCRLSANPIGRLLLHLSGEAAPDNVADSDRICTALQLTNHWQDLGQDAAENDRVYLPEDEMATHHVTPTQLRERRVTPGLVELMALQRDRARRMMIEGAALVPRLDGRLRWEIAFVVHGGLRVLEKLDHHAQEPFARPRLDAADWPLLAWRAARGVKSLR